MRRSGAGSGLHAGTYRGGEVELAGSCRSAPYRALRLKSWRSSKAKQEVSSHWLVGAKWLQLQAAGVPAELRG